MRAALALLLCGGASARLVLLQQITRHGIRAPKGKYLAKYCPKDPNNYKWDAWSAQLTGAGELEMEAVGQVVKSDYGGFLGPVWNGSRHYVRAADSGRVVQSAAAAMSTVWPKGTGPAGGPDGRPMFVPIRSSQEENDDLLTIEDAMCHDRLDADYQVWWNQTGAALLSANKRVMEPLLAFCGSDEELSPKLIKYQVDGIGFNQAVNMPTPGVTPEQLFAARNLSINLQEGDFATDAAKTYLAGALPAKLLDNIEDKLGGDGEDMERTYYAYFAHRHSLYGFAHFFGFTWEVDTPSVPRSSVATATTVFLELHTDDAKPPVYSVKLVLYHPHCKASGELAERYTACPRTPLNIPGCPGECTLAAFKGLIETRINRTGSYEELCGAGRANSQ